MADLKLVTSANGGWKDFTTQTSTLVRSLGLSILAIVWLLAGGLGDNADTPQQTLDLLRCEHDLWPAFVLGLTALVLDVVHYAVASFFYGLYSWTAATLVSYPPRRGLEFGVAYVLAWCFLLIRHIEDESNLPEAYGAARKDQLWNELDKRPRSAPVEKALEIPVAPCSVTIPPLIAFWLKTIAILLAYIYLARYVFAA